MVIKMREYLQKYGKQIIVVCVGAIVLYGLGWNVGRVVGVMSNQVMMEEAKNWGLGFFEDGVAPTGTLSAEELKEMNAYFIGDDTEKVIYLTFDVGFENGNTEIILDALKNHNLAATFFIVGYYLETNPDIVLRMIEEGHQVANHTYDHPDMTVKTETEFKEEIKELETAFQEVTGEEIASFYRPPQGRFNEDNLKWAEELGYETIFWSLAYVDWYENDQPTKEEAFDKLLNRIHPGAIVLLHSTSATNAQIMDELLTEWENMGYTFGSLTDL
ncbi:MAG: polysaccharide deacetylase family protein [Eubacteriales bacterium]